MADSTENKKTESTGSTPDTGNTPDTGSTPKPGSTSNAGSAPDVTGSSIEKILEKIIEQESSIELQELKRLAFQRAAIENSTSHARIPAPLNITEIGGYLNLLENDPEMKKMMLASILGIPYNL